jgi:hypothetical protein
MAKTVLPEGIQGLEDRPRPGRPRRFPPAQIAEVKALACELPAKSGGALSRWSAAEIARQASARGIVARVLAITVWRWLAEDAIRPWNYRAWIFPRDLRFAERAGPILDLYEGRWEGWLLQPGDFVVCADEKPSIQARARTHPTMIEADPPNRRVGIRAQDGIDWTCTYPDHLHPVVTTLIERLVRVSGIGRRLTAATGRLRIEQLQPIGEHTQDTLFTVETIPLAQLRAEQHIEGPQGLNAVIDDEWTDDEESRRFLEATLGS